LNTDAFYNLKYFSDHFKGVNYIKDARHRMAWCELLKGNTDAYYKTLNLITERGNVLSDSDKAAQNAATQRTIPHVELLKARLLMDGGYLTEAMNILLSIKESDLTKAEDRTEHMYRRGRIYHLQGKIEEAKLYYQKSIDSGKSLPVYFAANAAMELGSIYEQEQNFEKAKYYYKLSLAMPDSDFKNSIDIRSKAGLQRIGAA
jgi:tetratricopeptide (TPR) repeat protein